MQDEPNGAMNAGTVVARDPEHSVACRWCGDAFACVVGLRGRPQRYCSQRCRKRAELRVRVLRREHGALEMEIRIVGGLDNRLRLRELEAEIVRLGSSVRFVCTPRAY
jgi:hypothetical protein